MSNTILLYLKEEYGLERKDNQVNLNELFERLGFKESKTFINILDRVIEGKDFSINEAKILLHITCKSFFKIFDEYLESFSTPYNSEISVSIIIRNLFNKIIISLLEKNRGGEIQNNNRKRIVFNKKGYTIINDHICHETGKKIGEKHVYISRETRKKNLYFDDDYEVLVFPKDEYPSGGVDKVYGIVKSHDKEYIKFSNNNKENFIDFDGNLLFSKEDYPKGGVDKVIGTLKFDGKEYIKFSNNNKENLIDFDGNLLFSKEDYPEGGVVNINGLIEFDCKEYILFRNEKKSDNYESNLNSKGGVVNFGGELQYASEGSLKFCKNCKENLISSEGNLFFSSDKYTNGGIDMIDKKLKNIGDKIYIRFIDNCSEFFIDSNGNNFKKKENFWPLGGFIDRQDGNKRFYLEEVT